MLDPRLVLEAQARLAGAVERTPLVPFDAGNPRVELLLKLECLQVGGAFKARGAWNQVAQLSAAERARGVVTASSGNHARALAWAAERAGVRAVVCMPKDAYASKIDAARSHGAEVFLGEDRAAAEAEARRRADGGMVEIHPYQAERTLAGAGTAALEVLEERPDVDVIVVPVGGGGLLAGTALAIAALAARRGAPAEGTALVGVEPEGAPAMARALDAGRSVVLERIASRVQGLTPPYAGEINRRIAAEAGARILLLDDERILAGQRALVAGGGWRVEPAGAAGAAAVLQGRLPESLLARARPGRPLRVAAIVSGGNPDPAQFAALEADLRRERGSAV